MNQTRTNDFILGGLEDPNQLSGLSFEARVFDAATESLLGESPQTFASGDGVYRPRLATPVLLVAGRSYYICMDYRFVSGSNSQRFRTGDSSYAGFGTISGLYYGPAGNYSLAPNNFYPASSPPFSLVRAALIKGTIGPAFTSGTTAQRPPAATAGDQHYDSTLEKPAWYNGAVWKDAMGTTV